VFFPAELKFLRFKINKKNQYSKFHYVTNKLWAKIILTLSQFP